MRGPQQRSTGSLGQRLGEQFFGQDTLVVAERLIGSHMRVTTQPGGTVEAIIVETEAYLGDDDPASHAHRGATGRSEVMFRQGGVVYLYLVYGMYWCLNFVTGPKDVAGAVLIRAAELVSAEHVVRTRRKELGLDRAGRHTSRLLSGPGTLCQSLGLDGTYNRSDACQASSVVQLFQGASLPVVATTRIGIRAGQELPFRFFCPQSPAVT